MELLYRMAKSMRSKFKRKMRALKREKYYNREVDKLKKTTARIQLTSTPEILIKKEVEIPGEGNIESFYWTCCICVSALFDKTSSAVTNTHRGCERTSLDRLIDVPCIF